MKELYPIRLCNISIYTEIVFKVLVLSFSLSIYLGVEYSTQVILYSKDIAERSPEVAHKEAATIRDNAIRYTIYKKNIVYQKFCKAATHKLHYHRYIDSIFYKSVNNNKNYITSLIILRVD